MECPQVEVLRRWLAGGEANPEAAELWTHVSGCPLCTAEVSSLQATVQVHPEPSPQPGANELPPGALVGRYLVVEQVGRGSMGVVYAAYDSKLNRRVALKFLRVGLHERARARLLQEAQAMAAVRHPNVVSVYDVGTYEDQVFVVMEFVEGTRLGEWVRQQPRGWRTVLSHFLQAGEALHAVHLQGLVHRDFKPDNVLVGADGRVGVTDFGLARREQVRVAPLRTQAGAALVGTPAYMSPEQIEGREVDPRSDQFSFCVALYEALYGQRPFEDRDWKSLREAVLAGQVRALPSGVQVPGALRGVLLRGLSTDPSARHSSMRALLDALSRDPHRKAKWAAGATLGVGVVLGISLLVLRRDQLCRGAEAQWSGVWDPAVRARVEQAFSATGRPAASLSFQRVAPALDGFASGWARQREAACRATRVEGSQSEPLMELRMACLDQARLRVSELSRRLQQADGPTLDAIVLALPELPALETCADTERLIRRADASTPQQREQEARVRTALASAQPALMAGRPQEAAPALAQALELLTPLQAPALEAEARYLLGRLKVMEKDASGAEAALRRSALAAAAAREDAQEALAWIELVHVVGARLERYEEAHALAQVAQAAIRRVDGGAEALSARLEWAVAGVLVRQGKLEPALERYRSALVLHRRTHGEDDPFLAKMLSSQGAILRRMGRPEEAEAVLRESLSLAERLLGEHPVTANALVNLGPVLRAVGKLDQAQAALERAASIYERTTGPDGMVLTNLAVVIWQRGELEQALALMRKALELERGVDDVASTGYSLRINIGALLLDLGRPEEGRGWFEESLGLAQQRFPPESPILTLLVTGLADAQRQAEQLPAALRTAQEAVARAERHQGKTSPEYADAALVLGKIQLGLGKPSVALGLIEPAVPPMPIAGDLDDADAREWLARALVGARRDPPRARRLMEEALGTFDQGGSFGRRRAQQLRTWRRGQSLD